MSQLDNRKKVNLGDAGGDANLKKVRSLVEDCCGWNRKTWADAMEFAISQLPVSLDGKEVLEIGAGMYSSIAPVFASKRAKTICSYYGRLQKDVECGQLKRVLKKYNMINIEVTEQNIYDISCTYDIIALKSVFGGLCSGNDYESLRAIVDRLFEKNIKEGGALVTLDNGHVSLFSKMRKLWGAGQNEWTYFKRDKLIWTLRDYHIVIKGFGLLNAGAVKFLLGGNYELVNDIIYYIDKAVLRLVTSDERAVLSTIIWKTPPRDS
jgi:hypothetical protein